MSILKKFIISNIIMLFVPTILIILMTFIFMAIIIFTSSSNANLIDSLDINSINILSSILKQNPTAMKYVFLGMILSILTIIGVITTNTILLSRSIITPIHELTKSVEMMRHGNLDINILRSNDKDIDKLCQAFDDMRIELKQGKDLEQQYISERKMLLANLSHDLRTPITSIKGYIQGIQDGIADTPEKTEKYLSTIYAKTTVIEEMVNNMSVLAKLEMGKIEFDFEIGNLNDLLLQLADEYQIDIARNNITLDLNLTDTPAIIKIDYEKMRRVFSNLIDNAIKYRKNDSGHISISDVIQNDGVLVTVSDSGIGIKQSDITRIFEGFYRSDPARNLNVKGNGLGLGISKQIIEKHGGKIWAKSEQGEGTTIYVYLPLRKEI